MTDSDQGFLDDRTVLDVIENYFARARSVRPFMSMGSLATALSKAGRGWSTKWCFAWCETNDTWLEAHGFELDTKARGLRRI